MMKWLDRNADVQLRPLLKELLKLGYLRGEHTSLIAYDLDALGARLNELEEAFPKDTLHALAVKANPLPPVLRLQVERGFGLEAASRGELELALRAGCPPHRLVYDSPAKTEQELQFALQRGILINANSEEELRRIKSLGPRGRIGLRINPLVASADRASATMVATTGSKFGVPLPEAASIIKKSPFLNGLHVHIGSQVATLEDLVEGAGRVVELASEFPGIEWIDIGGGLPTRYRQSDPGLSPSDYTASLRETIPNLEKYRLITEVGRAVHAGCGWAASRVEYVEEGRAIIHLGADFCLRECYQGDEKWYHEIKVFDGNGEPKAGETQPVDLFGPLCFSGDLVAAKRLLPALEPGDIVVLCDAGCYTLSMWSRYCSRAIPEIVGKKEGEWSVLRRRETPEEVARFWEGQQTPGKSIPTKNPHPCV